MALPIGLVLGPVAIEIPLGIVIAGFLARCIARREWQWLRAPWAMLGLAWWGWLIFCSLPSIGAEGVFPRWTTQAVLAGRFLLLAAAAESFLTRDDRTRQRFVVVLRLVMAYVVFQLLWQLTTGTNLFGHAIHDNGLLTGPFDRPRAGPTLMHLFFPVLLPPVVGLLRRPGVPARLGGYALLAGGVAVMVPIGQRMPLLLVGFGLLVAAVLLPELRRAVALAIPAGAVTLVAGSVLFPDAQFRLVQHFAEQLGQFPTSHYGLIFTRAAAMVTAHPWLGRGFAGFRTGCGEARYFAPSVDSRLADGGGAEICVTHTHNFYLEAATDSGILGLGLFVLLTVAWLQRLWPGRGVDGRVKPGHDGDLVLGTALFIAALLHLWPIAGTNTFTNQYMAGWFFLLLGWGLAEVRRRASG